MSKLIKKIFVRNPVNGGTPAIEKKEIESKKRELGCRLNPENEFNVLLVEIKMVDRIQKTKISEIL